VTNLGKFFVKLRTVGRFAESLEYFFLKACGPCVNLCEVRICGRCIDCGLIIIKLHERGLVPGRCHKIVREVA
jgi:hypothetical protein